MKVRGFQRQLRWRIIAAHMAVVVVGVLFVLGMAWLITSTMVPADVGARLDALTSTDDVTAATADLLDTFRGSILKAVSVAALAAVVTGLFSSLVLAREILRPLRQIAASSRRIARGHFNERVAIPPSDELAQMAINFNQMAEVLASVEEQRVNLIGNVSHELRTPLAGLNGYLEGLQDGVFPADEETFALMATEVRRLRRLVDDLQALSRVEAGQISLDLQPVVVAEAVERVLAQLRPQAEAADLDLRLAGTGANGETAVVAYADPDRTAQVLLNLVGNAIRYTPPGGAITVRMDREQHNAVVAIEDTGVGIPAEALPYLFERFYRVDPSRTRQSGGSGIGLTISRHLLWAMGGELMVDSPGRDQGSTFTFTLPLSKS